MLSDNENKILSQSLGLCKNLIRLTINLSFNTISNSISLLLNGLKDCLNLSSLKLTQNCNNQLSLPRIKYESLLDQNQFLNVTSLKLELSSSGIYDDSVKSITSQLASFKYLKILSLRLKFNKLKDLGVFHIGQLIASLTNLDTLTLDLGFNKFGGIQVLNLGQEIGKKCTNLKKLKILIEDIQFYDQDEISTCKSLLGCQKLQTLIIDFNPTRNQYYGNDIQNNEYKTLCSILKRFINLQILSLRLNQTRNTQQLSEIRFRCMKIIRLTSLSIL